MKNVIQVKNQIITHQIPKENLKQLGLRNYCLLLSNGCSVLHLTSSKSRTHNSIKIFSSATRINANQKGICFLPNYSICRYLEIKHSFKIWLNDNSWCEIFADFSKPQRNRKEWDTVLKKLNWKIKRKINYIRSCSSRKAEFLSEIASFLLRHHCVIFAAKIRIRKLYISNSKYFIDL